MCWCVGLLVVWFFAWLVCSISYWLGFPTPGTVAGIALGATGYTYITHYILHIQYSYTMESHYSFIHHGIPRHRPYRILMEPANTILFGVSGGCWSHCRRRCVLRLAGAAQRVRPAQRPGQRRWPTHRAFVSWRGRGGAPAEHMQLVHVSQP